MEQHEFYKKRFERGRIVIYLNLTNRKQAETEAPFNYTILEELYTSNHLDEAQNEFSNRVFYERSPQLLDNLFGNKSF